MLTLEIYNHSLKKYETFLQNDIPATFNSIEEARKAAIYRPVPQKDTFSLCRVMNGDKEESGFMCRNLGYK